MLNPFYNPIRYSIEKKNFLRFNFSGLDEIQINYSQLHQDMFVLFALDGQANGTYLEIGGNEPILNSNTYLLEHFFEWKGISIEISPQHVERFNALRNNECLLLDATTANYSEIIDPVIFSGVIDYLSVDCEPPSTTFKALKKIPHEIYQFKVITFEHDYGAASLANNFHEMEILEKSREFLVNLGYQLIVPNVSWMNRPIEDWWVNPNFVSVDRLMNFVDLNLPNNDHVEFMYGKVG
jgi:hypothetical protein